MTKRKRRRRRAPDGFEAFPHGPVMDALLEAVGYKRSVKEFNAESKRLMGKP